MADDSLKLSPLVFYFRLGECGSINFDGTMDEVRICEHALSEQEIAEEFEQQIKGEPGLPRLGPPYNYEKFDTQPLQPISDEPKTLEAGRYRIDKTKYNMSVPIEDESESSVDVVIEPK